MRSNLAAAVIGCALRIHRTLGPGFSESVYERSLARELELNELRVEVQVPLPLINRGETIDCGYHLDLVVEDKLFVEVKCVEMFLPIHETEMRTYLKLSPLGEALLINFEVGRLEDGVKSYLNPNIFISCSSPRLNFHDQRRNFRHRERPS